MAPLKQNEIKTNATPADTSSGESIDGVIENVIYRSPDTGYTVCTITVRGRKELVTVVGNCHALWEGEILEATGKWIHHRQHGMQFQADNMVCHAPATVHGIERYLGSGMIRGIGKELARRVVKMFGVDTLRIIDKESARLEDVDGIGPTRRQMIKESWMEQLAVRDIMVFLRGHGVGTAQANRIYKQYGADAVNIIRRNPYRLCSDVWGIGFKSADQVAASLGVSRESEQRACAGIVHVMNTLTEEGHCYAETDELLAAAEQLLEIPRTILEPALNVEIKRGSLVNDRGSIYPSEIHESETGVAAKLRSLMAAPVGFAPIQADKAIPWAEERIRIHLDPHQVEALRMALTSKVSIITGGPGVGKTTIIRALVDIFKARKLPLALAAPTGRAAKRMEEATHHPASTIHRMLKYTPKVHKFEFGPGNPLKESVVILDEVSMVDIKLMHAFLSALRDDVILVLVGDVDQLPSVGPGNVLRDAIDSAVIPFRRLETIFRQAAGGWIVQNAHRVNRGEDIGIPDEKQSSDFFFFPANEPDRVVNLALDLVTRRIPGRFGFDPMDDIQVLTPMRRNQLGADNLNVLLQEALNPQGEAVQRFGRKYRVGDRVMQIRNNYDKEIYNGDIGRLTRINTVDQTVDVTFDNRKVTYEWTEIDELVHAYACSIHKSQGSEYPVVVLLIATQHFKLLQRNLLYTGITRGRKLVCLVGSHKAVGMAIRNNQIQQRRTALKTRLQRLE